jgi:hypothetical protein
VAGGAGGVGVLRVMGDWLLVIALALFLVLAALALSAL